MATAAFKVGDKVAIGNYISSGTPPFTATFKRFDGTVIQTFIDVWEMSQIVNYTLSIQDTIFTVELSDSCKDSGGAKHTVVSQQIIVTGASIMEGTIEVTVSQPEQTVNLVLKKKQGNVTVIAKDEAELIVPDAIISIDNVEVGKTDVNGISIIPNVPYGVHVIKGVK